ncbi:MAG TPA: AMP-binding protein [Acidimicrobiales bacterium]|nr:AMP-binding protein [Acidimicrobiales bacterium]
MDRAQLEQFQMHGQDIPWLMAHWAERKPDHPVLVWEPREGGGRRWTYRELLEDTRRLAAGLAARGIGRGDKVLIHSDNCPEMVLTWLACATLGAVGVTTNTKSVAAELAYFVEKAQCVAAVTQPQYASLVAEAAGHLKWIAVTDDNSGEPASGEEAAHGHDRFASLMEGAGAWAGRAAEPMLPFGIMFTSGTTSKPKAVVHTHANAVWASRLGPRNIDLGPDDTYLIYLPFFHTNAQSWSFFSVLGAGATAVLMPKWSTSRFWDVVARNDVTHISMMGFVMGLITAPDRPKTRLRVAVFGHVLPELELASGIGIYAAYGMTETVTHAITAKPVEQLPARSMGHVTPGYEIAVVDKETGALCAEDETGELWLRGTRGIQLMLEYFDDPAANAKAFEDGWFKTGDMVKMGAGGNVYYQERDKDVLKVGGENVSAKEVEELVLTVPGVAQVAVVGKQHEFLDQVPVAFVITRAGAPDDAELERQVLALCRERLAEFKVPRAVYVVDAFPTGTLDKILKNKLREMADDRPPV